MWSDDNLIVTLLVCNFFGFLYKYRPYIFSAVTVQNKDFINKKMVGFHVKRKKSYFLFLYLSNKIMRIFILTPCFGYFT